MMILVFNSNLEIRIKKLCSSNYKNGFSIKEIENNTINKINK